MPRYKKVQAISDGLASGLLSWFSRRTTSFSSNNHPSCYNCHVDNVIIDINHRKEIKSSNETAAVAKLFNVFDLSNSEEGWDPDDLDPKCTTTCSKLIAHPSHSKDSYQWGKVAISSIVKTAEQEMVSRKHQASDMLSWDFATFEKCVCFLWVDLPWYCHTKFSHSFFSFQKSGKQKITFSFSISQKRQRKPQRRRQQIPQRRGQQWWKIRFFGRWWWQQRQKQQQHLHR